MAPSQLPQWCRLGSLLKLNTFIFCQFINWFSMAPNLVDAAFSVTQALNPFVISHFVWSVLVS